MLCQHCLLSLPLPGQVGFHWCPGSLIAGYAPDALNRPCTFTAPTTWIFYLSP